jgi:hypothetical protein
MGSRVGGLAGFSPPSIFPYHESNRLPCYYVLNHFCNHGFTGSSFHIPSSAISILHPKICDLHYDHQTYRAPKYLISPVLSLTNHSETLSLFSIFRNHGFVGSWLAGSQKFPNPNCSRPSPPSSCFSQYTFKYGLMLITHHAGSVNIVINK